MIPPEQIKVSAFRYQVRFDSAALQTRCNGTCDNNGLLIVVDPTLPYDQQADTLLHEVEHAIFYVAGVHDEKLTEHQAIDRTSTLRLAVLRENPDLVAFLLDRIASV